LITSIGGGLARNALAAAFASSAVMHVPDLHHRASASPVQVEGDGSYGALICK
jgi:hypothetical protein